MTPTPHKMACKCGKNNDNSDAIRCSKCGLCSHRKCYGLIKKPIRIFKCQVCTENAAKKTMPPPATNQANSSHNKAPPTKRRGNGPITVRITSTDTETYSTEDEAEEVKKRKVETTPRKRLLPPETNAVSDEENSVVANGNIIENVFSIEEINKMDRTTLSNALGFSKHILNYKPDEEVYGAALRKTDTEMGWMTIYFQNRFKTLFRQCSAVCGCGMISKDPVVWRLHFENANKKLQPTEPDIDRIIKQTSDFFIRSRLRVGDVDFGSYLEVIKTASNCQDIDISEDDIKIGIFDYHNDYIKTIKTNIDNITNCCLQVNHLHLQNEIALIISIAIGPTKEDEKKERKEYVLYIDKTDKSEKPEVKDIVMKVVDLFNLRDKIKFIQSNLVISEQICEILKVQKIPCVHTIIGTIETKLTKGKGSVLERYKQIPDDAKVIDSYVPICVSLISQEGATPFERRLVIHKNEAENFTVHKHPLAVNHQPSLIIELNDILRNIVTEKPNDESFIPYFFIQQNFQQYTWLNLMTKLRIILMLIELPELSKYIQHSPTGRFMHSHFSNLQISECLKLQKSGKLDAFFENNEVKEKLDALSKNAKVRFLCSAFTPPEVKILEEYEYILSSLHQFRLDVCCGTKAGLINFMSDFFLLNKKLYHKLSTVEDLSIKALYTIAILNVFRIVQFTPKTFDLLYEYAYLNPLLTDKDYEEIFTQPKRNAAYEKWSKQLGFSKDDRSNRFTSFLKKKSVIDVFNGVRGVDTDAMEFFFTNQEFEQLQPFLCATPGFSALPSQVRGHKDITTRDVSTFRKFIMDNNNPNVIDNAFLAFTL